MIKIIIGFIIGCLTCGLLFSGSDYYSGRQWSSYEIDKVIYLLQQIAENTQLDR